MWVNVRTCRREISCKFADDFFKNVFERDNPLDITIFVNDKRDAFFACLEISNLALKRRVFWNEVDLVDLLNQGRFVRLLTGQKTDGVSNVQHANDVINVLSEYRQSGVLCVSQLIDDVL